MDGDDEVRKSRSLGQSKEQKEGCKLLVPDLCCVQCSHVAVYICIREAQTERDNKGGEGGDGGEGLSHQQMLDRDLRLYLMLI